MTLTQKEIVEELRAMWKKLWQERFDDKLRAEGVATNDYAKLLVDRGTVIHATRDFKALNFKEILQQYQVANADRFIPPNPHIGGWTKFIKTSITKQKSREKKKAPFLEVKKKKQQLAKGGRGWLHF